MRRVHVTHHRTVWGASTTLELVLRFRLVHQLLELPAQGLQALLALDLVGPERDFGVPSLVFHGLHSRCQASHLIRSSPDSARPTLQAHQFTRIQ